jgi:hypothetical protein
MDMTRPIFRRRIWLTTFQPGEGEVGRGVVAPGGKKGLLEGALRSFREKNAGAALAAPGTVDGRESGGMAVDKFLLLNGSEPDHAALFVGIAERGKNLSGHAKVGMVHVPALLGLRQREGQAAEFGCSGGHGRSSGQV